MSEFRDKVVVSGFSFMLGSRHQNEIVMQKGLFKARFSIPVNDESLKQQQVADKKKKTSLPQKTAFSPSVDQRVS